jgi:glutathione S-transferase
MMKLHWSPKSPYVRKVMVVAHELDCLQHIELVRTVAAMMRPNEALMRDNPLSKIPALVLEDGSALFDSIVICEYLDARFGGSLFPCEDDRRWRSLRWNALGDGVLDALILWRNERERPVARQSPELLAAFEHKLQACLRLLETESSLLARSPFCVGQVSLACALGYLDFRFGNLHWRALAPALAVWAAEIGHRPSLAASLPVPDA